MESIFRNTRVINIKVCVWNMNHFMRVFYDNTNTTFRRDKTHHILHIISIAVTIILINSDWLSSQE
jgi:hypothetical protein